MIYLILMEFIKEIGIFFNLSPQSFIEDIVQISSMFIMLEKGRQREREITLEKVHWKIKVEGHIIIPIHSERGYHLLSVDKCQ